MITIANANALHIPLPDKSVQCVVTSPPYWGLRDYGTATWEGGSAECDHVYDRTLGMRSSTLGGGKANQPAGSVYRECPRCGARRIDAQIGLESTPAAYVAHIVAVMRECWRVLKDDGVMWLNLGDSYAQGGAEQSFRNATNENWSGGSDAKKPRYKLERNHGLKPKDLCGIPWRVAFALQDDGWYLRSDIIWHKPNPMPESVTDRPTKAHEYVFLLTKKARYYYDAEAIKEASVYPDDDRKARSDFDDKRMPTDSIAGVRPGSATYPTRNRRSVWTIATSPYSGKKDFRCTVCNGTGYQLISKMDTPPMTNEEWLAWCESAEPCPACYGSGEQSTNIDHFATFPPALIEPMILAGTSARGECPHCGKAWVRMVETEQYNKPGRNPENHANADRNVNARGLKRPDNWYGGTNVNTLGWRQQCVCPPHEPVPQTVLDPFAGSGTTGQVAVKHGRRAVLLDLNCKYIDLQFDRTSGIQVTMGL
jgi:DNA modification methylase